MVCGTNNPQNQQKTPPNRLPSDSDMSRLNQAVNKDNGITDWGSSLRWLWKSDNTKNWNLYSDEQFTRFWDIRVVEHRS
jgi:hypothetical protein